MKTSGLVAFAGEVTLDKAVEDTDWGMYVVLQIEQKPQEKDHANPFKRFTRMRKGNVGTRFDAVFTFKDEVAYDNEVMLKGWSDSTTGWKVTLWVNTDDEGRHPFMKFIKGSQFALVTVELDDDNGPINQVKRERLTRAEARKKYPLAMLAGQLCKNEQFHRWLIEERSVVKVMSGQDHLAKKFVVDTCGIESRRELDSNPDAADTFHNSIRKPYLVWLGEQDDG